MIVRRLGWMGCDGYAVWRRGDELLLREWNSEDPEEPRGPEPEPSFVLGSDEANEMVVAVLRGEMGECGPVGATGPQGPEGRASR